MIKFFLTRDSMVEIFTQSRSFYYTSALPSMGVSALADIISSIYGIKCNLLYVPSILSAHLHFMSVQKVLIDS